MIFRLVETVERIKASAHADDLREHRSGRCFRLPRAFFTSTCGFYRICEINIFLGYLAVLALPIRSRNPSVNSTGPLAASSSPMTCGNTCSSIFVRIALFFALASSR